MSKLLVVLLIASVRGCYWNSHCPYMLFGSKTPYDTIRGDIRDYAIPPSCTAVSIWALLRHGNRNPGTSATLGMKEMSLLKDDIIKSWESGSSQLCAQDIESFRTWQWNDTMDVSTSFLTGTGYEEIYDIGRRLKEKYPHLLHGLPEQFYFRPTNEQRTVASCAAFANGITDGTDLNFTMDEARLRDDVIRPYENCDRYQQEVKGGSTLASQLDSYFLSAEYVAIQNAVQYRLGISKQLNASNVFSMYELCRFFRSWQLNHRSPWCSIFTEQDLIHLEYYDDVRHFYRNGHGSWVNGNLGRLPMKNLYESFRDFVLGGGKKLTAYFSHDTMLEMTFTALGLYKDENLQALLIDPERNWRSSYIGAFSTNIIAVLNNCNDSGSPTTRVQLFINERETPLCPIEGCSWVEFVNYFKPFADATLDFCSMDYQVDSKDDSSTNRAAPTKPFWHWNL